MLSFLKQTLTTIFHTFTTKVNELFTRGNIDEAALQELEIMLIQADTGVQTTRQFISQLREQLKTKNHLDGLEVKQALETYLTNLLTNQRQLEQTPVYLLVGINGSGKTTFAGKLAHQLAQNGKRVLLVAGDTFRAAAPEQLTAWAEKTGVDVVVGSQDQDPAAVAFTGCKKFIDDKYDHLIIDTAGRVQTNVNLMNELSKIKRVVHKQLGDTPVTTLLTVDSMLGQNSVAQAQVFHQHLKLDGVVLTKMDGTGKGGTVFAIVDQLNLPVAFLSFGEDVAAIKSFDPQTYVRELLDG